MQYLSDKMRVECAIPPSLIYSIFASSIFPEDTKSEGSYKRIHDVFFKCAHEPEEGLVPQRAEAIRRRCLRAIKPTLQEWDKAGVDPVKALMMVVEFVNGLVDDGFLKIDENSPFQQAFNELVEALESGGDADRLQEPQIIKSAAKQAPKLRARFEKMSYYK